MDFCTICQEPILNGQVRLNCGHLFHKRCLCDYHDNIHRYEDPFSCSINITGCPNCRVSSNLKNICGDKEYYFTPKKQVIATFNLVKNVLDPVKKKVFLILPIKRVFSIYVDR